MSSTHGYDREGFLSEFFPDAGDRNEVEVGAQALISISRAHRLAEMRRGCEAAAPKGGDGCPR